MSPLVDSTPMRDPLPMDTDGDELCWICLDDKPSDQPFVSPCACPRKVHPKCLARWQLQQAGRPEETTCRFCMRNLDDWKQNLTPEALKPEVQKVQPIMVVYFEGEIHRIPVKQGSEGVKEFTTRIRELFRLPEDVDISLTFGCKEPMSGQHLKLEGIGAFDAAVHCASVAAAERQHKSKTGGGAGSTCSTGGGARTQAGGGGPGVPNVASEGEGGLESCPALDLNDFNAHDWEAETDRVISALESEQASHPRPVTASIQPTAAHAPAVPALLPNSGIQLSPSQDLLCPCTPPATMQSMHRPSCSMDSRSTMGGADRFFSSMVASPQTPTNTARHMGGVAHNPHCTNPLGGPMHSVDMSMQHSIPYASSHAQPSLTDAASPASPALMKGPSLEESPVFGSLSEGSRGSRRACRSFSTQHAQGETSLMGPPTSDTDSYSPQMSTPALDESSAGGCQVLGTNSLTGRLKSSLRAFSRKVARRLQFNGKSDTCTIQAHPEPM